MFETADGADASVLGSFRAASTRLIGEDGQTVQFVDDDDSNVWGGATEDIQGGEGQQHCLRLSLMFDRRQSLRPHKWKQIHSFCNRYWKWKILISPINLLMNRKYA